MKTLMACLAALILFSGCAGTRSHNVADVTKAETIILTKEPGQGPIHTLSVVGSGMIQGNAEITLILNHDQPYKTETLSSGVDFYWRGDWYSDQAEIHYTPTSVTGGNIKLTYKFYD
ncbi:MAG: hypothetical protein KDI79_05895 [Anaerolineae bacterium]|nr:hypothetical protein [Anaerolineae bacterium]